MRPSFLRIIAVLLCFNVSSLAAEEMNEASRALLHACLGSQPDIQGLVDADGVNLNVRDTASGQTPLMASVLRGNAAAVRILLKAGADASLGEKDGYTPPHGAAFQGRVEVLKILVEEFQLNVQEFHTDGYLPFHRACWGRTQGHVDFIAYMIQHKLAEIDVPAKDGRTCREMTKSPLVKAAVEQYYKGDEL